MNRRGFLKGILAAGVAPAIVGSEILMPVRAIAYPYATSARDAMDKMQELLLRQAEMAIDPPILVDSRGAFQGFSRMLEASAPPQRNWFTLTV